MKTYSPNAKKYAVNPSFYRDEDGIPVVDLSDIVPLGARVKYERGADGAYRKVGYEHPDG